MPLYKIVKMGTMPPGCLILALMVMALLLWLSANKLNREESGSNRLLYYVNKIAGVLAMLLAGGTLLLSMDAVSQRLLQRLEYRYPKVEVMQTAGSYGTLEKVDAIYVLGGDTEVRCQRAYELYKAVGVELVVSGYQGEAGRMRDYLVAKGVPETKIILEPEATNTKDHLKYMLPIALRKEHKRVFMVTSAFHLPRSMMLLEQPFHQQGVEIIPVGCGYWTQKEYIPWPQEWVPNMLSYYHGTTALNEYLGMLVLWAGGQARCPQF